MIFGCSLVAPRKQINRYRPAAFRSTEPVRPVDSTPGGAVLALVPGVDDADTERIGVANVGRREGASRPPDPCDLAVADLDCSTAALWNIGLSLADCA
jgi:hypothetical protein